MIFTFFITIVFIAELIIATSIILNLLKLNRISVDYDKFLYEIKPKVQSIFILGRKISEQFLELTPIWIKNFRNKKDAFILNQIKNLIVSVFLWKTNIKIIKKLRRNKFVKTALKSFTLLQNMV